MKAKELLARLQSAIDRKLINENDYIVVVQDRTFPCCFVTEILATKVHSFISNKEDICLASIDPKYLSKE